MLEDESEAIISHPCQHTACVCDNFTLADLQLLPPEKCHGCSHGGAVHGLLVIPCTVPDTAPPPPPRASWRDRLDASRAGPAASTYSSPARPTASAASAASADHSSPGSGSAMSQMLIRMRASPAAAQATGVAVKARSPYAPNNTWAIIYVCYVCFASPYMSCRNSLCVVCFYITGSGESSWLRHAGRYSMRRDTQKWFLP